MVCTPPCHSLATYSSVHWLQLYRHHNYGRASDFGSIRGWDFHMQQLRTGGRCDSVLWLWEHLLCQQDFNVLGKWDAMLLYAYLDLCGRSNLLRQEEY